MDSETFDRLVEEWHHSHSELPIHEYLGISLEEYGQLVSCPTSKYVIDVPKMTSKECKTFLKSQHEN